MSISKIVSLATVALLAACTANTNSDPVASGNEQDLSAKSMFSCKVDADCVAVEIPSCCPNGMHDAVNVNHVSQYLEQNECKDPPHVCPLFLIDDTRVATCDSATKKCA